MGARLIEKCIVRRRDGDMVFCGLVVTITGRVLCCWINSTCETFPRQFSSPFELSLCFNRDLVDILVSLLFEV